MKKIQWAIALLAAFFANARLRRFYVFNYSSMANISRWLKFV